VLSSQRRHSRRKPIRTQRLSKSVALAIAAIHANLGKKVVECSGHFYLNGWDLIDYDVSNIAWHKVRMLGTLCSSLNSF
jgi:hypothetical protein